MIPAVISGHKTTATAPKDWNDDAGKCAALPIRLEREGDLLFMRSAWQPTDDEVAKLLAGAHVELGISAPTHPVVQLGVGDTPDAEAVQARPVYVLRDVIDAEGQRHCRALVVIGNTTFPAGIAIAPDVPFPIAAMRVTKAIEDHLRAIGLLT